MSRRGDRLVGLRCATCDAVVAPGARYCASCGAAIDDTVPVLSLDREQATPAPPSDEPKDRSLRTLAGVALGIVALLVILSVVTSDGSDDADDAAPTTTQPPTTNQPQTAEPPASAIPPLLDGEALDLAQGMALVWIRSNGTVVVADLEHGAEWSLDDRLPVRPVLNARWTGETFLMLGVGEGLWRLRTDGSMEWDRIEAPDHHVDLPGGQWGNQVWAYPVAETGFFGPTAAMITDDGELSVIPAPSGNQVVAVGTILGRHILNTPDGVYLIDTDGNAERFGFGVVLGADDRHLVRRVCDDRLECRLVLDDLVDGDQVDLGRSDPMEAIAVASPAPDGSAVALLVQLPGPNGPSVRVHVVDGTAAVVNDFNNRHALGDASHLQWTPDSKTVIWLQEDRRQVMAISWGTASESSNPATISVWPDLRSSSGYQGLFLVPLDRLPAGWLAPD